MQLKCFDFNPENEKYESSSHFTVYKRSPNTLHDLKHQIHIYTKQLMEDREMWQLPTHQMSKVYFNLNKKLSQNFIEISRKC